MKSLQLLLAAGVLLSASRLTCGQMIEPTVAPPSTSWPANTPNPYDDLPLDELPLGTEGSVAPREEILSDFVVEAPVVPVMTSRFAIDITLADVDLNDGTARYRSNDPVSVRRGEFAFERLDGFGVRGVIWSFDRRFRLEPDDRLEARVASYYFDGYQRLVSEKGELLLGGGLAFGSLKIDSPYVDSPRRFNGIGGSLVAEGFYPFLRFEKTDVGLTGRARLAVLGPTEDNFGDSEAMLVDELGVGVELRRRWGKCQDKMWFVRVSREWQHWSDLDSPFSADQSLDGMSYLLGFAW